MYVNSCPDWYGKNVPVIPSVVYCFGCEGKGGLNKVLALEGGGGGGGGLI